MGQKMKRRRLLTEMLVAEVSAEELHKADYCNDCSFAKVLQQQANALTEHFQPHQD